jgi:hypothetical protein
LLAQRLPIGGGDELCAGNNEHRFCLNVLLDHFSTIFCIVFVLFNGHGVLLRCIRIQHMVRIRLTRKLALMMNGVDVSKLSIGDILELPEPAAEMMVAEGWGERVDEPAVTHLFARQNSQPATPS